MIDSKNFLKVFFTASLLWWLLCLQLLHQTNFRFTLKFFSMVKLGELGYKNCSHKNSVFLSKNPSNWWIVMSFKYQCKRISNWASNGQVMGFFMLLIFAEMQNSIDWDVSRRYRNNYQEVSRHMLKNAFFLSRLYVFNLIFNYNFKPHKKSIKEHNLSWFDITKTHGPYNLPLWLSICDKTSNTKVSPIQF